MDQQQYLHHLGLISYVPRHSAAGEEVTPATTATLDSLRETVANCTLCALHTTRTQTVFGVGNTAAKLMIIGEAPGERDTVLPQPSYLSLQCSLWSSPCDCSRARPCVPSH